MAKDDIPLIIKGGALCAALSFMALFIPIPGIVFHYFALMPIFYVGICLGIRSYLLAISIPLLGYLILLGPVGIGVFGITLFAPSITVLYWHFLKNKTAYKFSSTDILHQLSSRFLALTAVGFSYLKLTNSDMLDQQAKQIKEIFKLMKIPMSPDSFIEILPGMLAFFTLLIIWMNFQMAYSLALKSNKSIRKPTIKQNIFLPPVWDIALVTSLWLIIANHLFIDSPLLGVFSHAAVCICAFPLLIDGIEIAQLMARSFQLPRYATVIFMVLTFLLVWPMIFVVVLGLVEPLYGLKKKYYSKFN